MTNRKKTDRKPSKKTKPLPLLPPIYKMVLRFDAEQLTQSLQYWFLDPDGKRYGVVQDGPNAGTFNFPQGSLLQILVIGTADISKKAIASLAKKYGKNSRFLKSTEFKGEFDINVVNCALISARSLGDQDLSLFNPFSACTTITQWSLAGKHIDMIGEQDESRKTLQTEALNALYISAPSGQWQISGYLSVQIQVGGVAFTRLFYFDPEGSAGSGTGLGEGGGG